MHAMHKVWQVFMRSNDHDGCALHAIESLLYVVVEMDAYSDEN